VIQLRKVQLAGYLACMGEIRHLKNVVWNINEKHHLCDLGVDDRIVLRQLLKKHGVPI
jgi:hypothetical protein